MKKKVIENGSDNSVLFGGLGQENKPKEGGKKMPNAKDIKALEKKITALSNALAKLNNKDDFRKLILEWRRPGWTTPAEFIFVSGMIDSLIAHTGALIQLKGDLIKGSKAVRAQ